MTIRLLSIDTPEHAELNAAQYAYWSLDVNNCAVAPEIVAAALERIRVAKLACERVAAQTVTRAEIDRDDWIATAYGNYLDEVTMTMAGLSDLHYYPPIPVYNEMPVAIRDALAECFDLQRPWNDAAATALVMWRNHVIDQRRVAQRIGDVDLALVLQLAELDYTRSLVDMGQSAPAEQTLVERVANVLTQDHGSYVGGSWVIETIAELSLHGLTTCDVDVETILLCYRLRTNQIDVVEFTREMYRNV